MVSQEAYAADFRIEQLVPAETQEVDTSGTPWVAVTSPEEPWKIENLEPAD